MSDKKDVINNRSVKCTRCAATFRSSEIRVEILTLGMLTTGCPMCGGTFTVSPFPSEYITVIEDENDAH